MEYYYDDIIIASDGRSHHIQLVNDLYEALLINGLTVSREKLQLAQLQIHFLGYSIQYNRISIDEEKRNTKNQKLPTTKEASIKFIGFTNLLSNLYAVHRTLKPFYTMAATTNKEQKIALNNIVTPGFQNIKEQIHTALMLKLLDPQQPAVIFLDASKEGTSAIVEQPETENNNTQLFPIAFYCVRSN